MSTLFAVLVLNLLISNSAMKTEPGTSDVGNTAVKTEPDTSDQQTYQYTIVKSEKLEEDDGIGEQDAYKYNTDNIPADENISVKEENPDGNVDAPQTTLPAPNTNYPLTLVVDNLEATLFGISADTRLSNEVKVTDNDAAGYTLKPYQQKLHLCPYPSLKGEFERHNSRSEFAEKCLFETTFNPDQPKICESRLEPKFMQVRISEASSGRSSSQVPLRLFVVGAHFCFPVVNNGQENITIYRKGIEQFFEEFTPETNFTIRSKNFKMYAIYYDGARKKIRYTWHQVFVRDHRNVYSEPDNYDPNALSTDSPIYLDIDFEELRQAFLQQDINSPFYMLPRKLVPAGDRLFHFWKISTSLFANVRPLWKHFVPLMDLIEEHIRRVASMISRTLVVRTEVVTLPIRWKNPANPPIRNALLNPNIWSKVVLEPNTNSGIVIILSNTPHRIPAQNEECDEAAECDFKKWIHMSTSSYSKIDDTMLQFAYCCRTTKLGLLADVKFRNLLDINLKAPVPEPSENEAKKIKL